MKEKTLQMVKGIGIGLIVASILFYGLLCSNHQLISMTDEQVIERAEKLGMVFIKDFFKEQEGDNGTDKE